MERFANVVAGIKPLVTFEQTMLYLKPRLRPPGGGSPHWLAHQVCPRYGNVQFGIGQTDVEAMANLRVNLARARAHHAQMEIIRRNGGHH